MKVQKIKTRLDPHALTDPKALRYLDRRFTEQNVAALWKAFEKRNG